MDRNSNEMGLVAYNFEPEYSEEEMASRSQQHSIAEASSAFNVYIFCVLTTHVYRSQCNICQDFRFS